MPRVTISITAPSEALDNELLTLDLPGDDFTLEGLKSLVQVETQFPASSQQYYLNGRPLTDDSQTLHAAGIKDGDVLAVLIRRGGGGAQGQPGQAQQAGRPGPGGAGGRRRVNEPDPEAVRQGVLRDPAGQETLRQQNPELFSALSDPARWRELYIMELRKQSEAARERERQIERLNEDPFDVDAQRKIEEIIRQDRVIENLQHAYENNPEVFVRVHMLYINAEVNNHPVKAFVDSGAQATIMSPDCAQACGIMRLIDTRYAGIAKGVGTAKILGRVHHAEIQIGGASMPCAFTVMEGKDVDLLFGLDMLKRYKAKIDLEKNALCFQGIEVPFLPESEIPRNFEEAELNEPTVAGPNGTEIGARSGAVRPAGATSAGSSSVAAGSAPPPPQPSNPPQGATNEFPQADIDRLVDMSGASRDMVIQALQAANGDVEAAAGLLLAHME